MANGTGLDGHSLEWSKNFAVTTVVAAAGYPESPRKGTVIKLPPNEGGVHVFHAGTAINSRGQLVTSGGRVFAVTAVRPTLAEARRTSASAAESIQFDGKQFRRDVGWREQDRGAGVTGD